MCIPYVLVPTTFGLEDPDTPPTYGIFGLMSVP
jgi:hypothetical protein